MSENAVEIRGKAEFVDVGDREFKGGARIHGFKVNGTKYTAFIKSEKPIQNAKAGDTVKFTADVNQKGYWNFDPESFELLERGNTQPTQKQNYPQKDSPNYGMAIGHAINNATNLLVANGENVTLDEVKSTAIKIYQLSLQMQKEAAEGQYDNPPENNAPNDGPSGDDPDNISF